MFNVLKIKNLLRRKNITQEQLAAELNINRRTLGNYLTGKTSISVEVLERIASYFGVPVSYFFDEGSGSVVNNGNNSIVGGNIQITLAKKENEIELLKAKLEAKDNEIKTLREMIDVLKERCR